MIDLNMDKKYLIKYCLIQINPIKIKDQLLDRINDRRTFVMLNKQHLKDRMRWLRFYVYD